MLCFATPPEVWCPRAVDRSSSGSFCSSSSQIQPTPTSSPGRAPAGSSSSRTRMRWPGSGARGNQNPTWTTTRWVAPCATTTTRTSWPRCTASGTLTSLTSTPWWLRARPRDPTARTSTRRITLPSSPITPPPMATPSSMGCCLPPPPSPLACISRPAPCSRPRRPTGLFPHLPLWITFQISTAAKLARRPWLTSTPARRARRQCQISTQRISIRHRQHRQALLRPRHRPWCLPSLHFLQQSLQKPRVFPTFLLSHFQWTRWDNITLTFNPTRTLSKILGSECESRKIEIQVQASLCLFLNKKNSLCKVSCLYFSSK